ncbi:MAG: hypothetical protein NUW37_11130 [Planctomycetes bacterium]|nr:hypothetical protein [Planctomycetota bacterium]
MGLLSHRNKVPPMYVCGSLLVLAFALACSGCETVLGPKEPIDEFAEIFEAPANTGFRIHEDAKIGDYAAFSTDGIETYFAIVGVSGGDYVVEVKSPLQVIRRVASEAGTSREDILAARLAEIEARANAEGSVGSGSSRSGSDARLERSQLLYTLVYVVDSAARPTKAFIAERPMPGKELPLARRVEFRGSRPDDGFGTMLTDPRSELAEFYEPAPGPLRKAETVVSDEPVRGGMSIAGVSFREVRHLQVDIRSPRGSLVERYVTGDVFFEPDGLVLETYEGRTTFELVSMGSNAGPSCRLPE